MRSPNAKCSICSKPFYTRPSRISSFCSRECYGKAQRKSHSCPVCEKEVLAGEHKIACSKGCSNTLRKLIREGKHPNVYPGHDQASEIKAIRKMVISERGNACELCGYSAYDILNVHHIVEQSKGGTHDRSNLKLVCPNCHAELHKGFRTL